MIYFKCPEHGLMNHIQGSVPFRMNFSGKDSLYYSYDGVIEPNRIVNPVCFLCQRPVILVTQDICPHSDTIEALYIEPMDSSCCYAILRCSICDVILKRVTVTASMILNSGV